jgi:hypothetical protein
MGAAHLFIHHIKFSREGDGRRRQQHTIVSAISSPFPTAVFYHQPAIHIHPHYSTINIFYYLSV